VECGAPAVVCPACGEPAASSNRFCRACGRALTGTASGSPAVLPAAGPAFAAAIAGLRQHSTPYHLAHGLLDHAAHLLRTDDNEAARAAIGEARDIAGRLRCQPVLDRAAHLTPARPPTRA
jgi:hypothetical protein